MPHRDDAQYWRMRAAEAHVQANDEDDRGAKWMMLKVVKGYELLAQRAEQQAIEPSSRVRS